MLGSNPPKPTAINGKIHFFYKDDEELDWMDSFSSS